MQPTPVLLPGKSQGQRNLGGLQSLELQRFRHDGTHTWMHTCMHMHTHTHTHTHTQLLDYGDDRRQIIENSISEVVL